MSHESNALLLEWAAEIMEEFAGTWMARRVAELVEDNDLEELRRFISRYGAEMSQMHFHNRNIEEVGDVY